MIVVYGVRWVKGIGIEVRNSIVVFFSILLIVLMSCGMIEVRRSLRLR